MTNKSDSINGSGFQNRMVHNLIILDESGSMEVIKNATITGFNEVVQTIKGVEKQFPEEEQFVSLVTFNGLEIKTNLFNKRVKNLKEIDEEIFQPDSLTPLYDAIGFSVNKLRKEIESQKDCHVLVTILTDGEENDSRE
ncbi:MAG: VWA domain-containing protein [Pyrinomonadaceae bacterium]